MRPMSFRTAGNRRLQSAPAMSSEREIKYRIHDVTSFRASLAAVGATCGGTFLERSVILDRPDRSLLAANSALRLRERSSLDGADAATERLLTYKGPVLESGAVKQREEIEFNIGDFDDAIRLFDRIGFRGVICYERRRETWRLGACEVAVDELPDNSTFVEIEGPSVEAVLASARTLQLRDSDRDPVTYVEYAARCGKPERGFIACLAFDDGP